LRGPRTASEGEDERGAGRLLVVRPRELEPTGEHGVDCDSITGELEQDELPTAADTPDLLAHEGSELRRRAAHGKWGGRLGAHDRSTGERGVEGVRHDRQIGQLGHGGAIVAAYPP